MTLEGNAQILHNSIPRRTKMGRYAFLYDLGAATFFY